jgi:hypothetical protein
MHQHDDTPPASPFDTTDYGIGSTADIRMDTKQPLARMLIEALLGSNAVLFHDQFHNGYIALQGDGAEVLRLSGQQFRHWLHYYAYVTFGRPLNSNTASETINTLEGHARHEGLQYPLAVRVARHDGTVWYDLGREVVRITKEGWAIVERPPILFRRYSHQQKQVTPDHVGSLTLLKLVLPPSMTEAQVLLFTVSLITGLIPDIPQTIDVIFGDHGSAKSTLTKLKKALLDPSVIDESTPPTSVPEFIQLLAHHWYVPLGNLTHLPGWMSDCISRASTGSGFAKRELYSDDDDVIYRFFRPVGLNGITLAAEKPDLLDRALLFGDLARIPDDKRRADAEVWGRFEVLKPAILGGMFDALAGAMQHIDEVQLAQTPRMADFTRWGCAVAEALHRSKVDFLTAYQTNIASQHEEAIEANPMGLAVLEFMEKWPLWEGSPSDLLRALQPIAEGLQVEHHRSFPKDATWVWRRLKEVRVNLQEKGIACAQRKSGSDRLIKLNRNGGKSTVPAAPTVPDDG